MNLRFITLILITILSVGLLNAASLEGIRIAILTADSTHDAELLLPYGFFINQGAEVSIISDAQGEMDCYNSEITYHIEKLITDCKIEDYDVLLIPGGHAPAILRRNESVNQFVLEFAQTGKLVAAICHGPQLLVPTGLLEGKQATCVGLMKAEYENANIEFINQNVVITDNLITGKNPRSISEWCVTIKNEIIKRKSI